MVDLADAGAKEVFNKTILREIGGGVGISLALSVGWLYVSNFKVLTWLLQRIRATQKYGNEDVWDHTFNSRDAAVEYVHVRDFANQYVYAAWANAFSETSKLRELVLLDVNVYDFEGKELYQTPRIYLARSPENIHIEFPYRHEDGRAHG